MSEALNADTGVADALDGVHAAQVVIRADRSRGLAALNALFRDGWVPDPPPDGAYTGELVAVDIAPGLSALLEWLASLWMPWKGKSLIRAEGRGVNIFGRGSRLAMRLLFPFYRGMVDHDAQSFRAFVFETSLADGMVDPDRRVFRIDYDRPDNPALTIRRIVDEIVQVADGVYLGKIHFKWWWGRWTMVGYFSLRRGSY
jgi:hypothetical protein